MSQGIELVSSGHSLDTNHIMLGSVCMAALRIHALHCEYKVAETQVSLMPFFFPNMEYVPAASFIGDVHIWNTYQLLLSLLLMYIYV